MTIETIPLQGSLIIKPLLAAYTSWKVGGEAKQLYRPSSVADLQAFLSQLPSNEPLLWLGLGSNLLIRDGGFTGTVIETRGGLEKIDKIDDLTIRVEAGVACATFARYCARSGLTGAEFLAGIPGTIGGALMMNAGCFGGETWGSVVEVEMMDNDGKITHRLANEFTIGYRSVLPLRKEWFIAGIFRLRPGNKEKSLEVIRNLLEKRSATQPTGVPSCGSVFCNPPNDYAARLIEAAGMKGYQKGGATVSRKHANFIVNENNAKARDIEELIIEIASEVKRQFSIELKTEVRIIGEK